MDAFKDFKSQAFEWHPFCSKIRIVQRCIGYAVGTMILLFAGFLLVIVNQCVLLYSNTHLSFLADKIVMQAFSTALGEINMLEKLAMNLGLFF